MNPTPKVNLLEDYFLSISMEEMKEMLNIEEMKEFTPKELVFG